MTSLERSISFSFNTIFVIESLREGENTAQELVNVLKWTIEKTRFRLAHMIVENKTGLFEAFDFIEEEVKKSGTLPCIHLELHGNHNGVQLKSKEFITWNEIGRRIRGINVLIKNNLLITLAVCYGIHVYKQIDVMQRSPFIFALAPLEEVKEGAIEEGFIQFYESLIETNDFVFSVRRLNNFEEKPMFQVIDTEELFHQAWGDFRKQFSSIEKIDQHIDHLIAEGKVADNFDPEPMRQTLKIVLEKGEVGKEEVYRHFMMQD